MKQMNKSRQTEHRISWTNLGLNVLLPLFKDVESLQSSSETSEITFVKGTQEDIAYMLTMIQNKVEENTITRTRPWKTDFWYHNIPEEPFDCVPPSNLVELAFANVGSLYVKHQYSWDNADIVAEVDNEFYESEPEYDSDVDM